MSHSLAIKDEAEQRFNMPLHGKHGICRISNIFKKSGFSKTGEISLKIITPVQLFWPAF